jgi:uncharacterized membrane protein YphA (DoxX/SURF4 family)
MRKKIKKASGGTKLFVPAQFSKMELTIAQSHIPFPHANAVFVSLVEFTCGAGLALGLLTPVCALLLVVVMIVAVATNRIQSIEANGYGDGRDIQDPAGRSFRSAVTGRAIDGTARTNNPRNCA